MAKYLTQLGYVGFEVSDLADWEIFASKILGLGVRPGPQPDTLLMRMDAYDRRFILTRRPADKAHDDVAFVGWQTADGAALDGFAQHLTTEGVAHAWGTEAELALRGVDRMLSFCDPNGVRHEAYCGPLMAHERFVSPSVAGNFVTGEAGCGHVVFGAGPYQEALEFSHGILGAALSDIIRQPMGPDFKLEVSFLHVNERHHSLAFAAAGGPQKLHHFMVEVDRIDEVGRARDRALAAGYKVVQDIGQHPNDRMISIYVQTPSGFLVEFGWGGVKVHDDDWQVVTYPAFSEWGHRPAAA